MACYFFAPRHLAEQYFTFSQIFSHFLRQVKGLPQVAQVLEGRLDFETPRISVHSSAFCAKCGATTIHANHLPCDPTRIRGEQKRRHRSNVIRFAQALRRVH